MPRTRFDQFTSASYTSWSPNVDSERLINLYPEIVESSQGKNKVAFYGTPGLTLFCTLPAGPVRALWAGEERLFAVGADKLYEVKNDATFTVRPGVAMGDDGQPVEIYANGTSLFFINAGLAYYDPGSGVALALVPEDPYGLVDTAAADPSTASTGAFLDSYYIAAKPYSKTFFFSDPYDPVTWNALEFSRKEGYPDNIKRLFTDHEELWIFGTHEATEVWRNEGDPDEAGGFRRDPGAFIHIALMAQWSVVSMAGGIHFLGGDTDGRVIAYRCQGFQPVRVSTHAVEQIWNTYSTVADAYAYTYTQHGHQFWVINFMTANATWVYDVNTQLWHERAYWNGTSFEKHRGRCHAFVFGKHFVGDHTNGKIYVMDHNAFTDAGQPIRRVRRCPFVANERKRVFHHRLELDLQVTAGNTPNINLSWSDNDGANWTTPRVITPQVVGNNQAHAFTNRLGSSAERQYEIMISDPVKVALVDAYIDVTPGNA